MKTKVFITGGGGFVGSYLIESLKHSYFFKCFKRELHPVINTQVVIHLAGIAHDLKKTKKESDYYLVNTELTKKIFNEFLKSKATVFITLSSVKAIADSIKDVLTEDHNPNPKTHYGKSKLLAENYILSKEIPPGKRVYILRPSMIHGPGNKGNMNLLYKLVSKGLYWPLGSFTNKRSFCSVDNLLFVIKELIERKDILSGVYNIADDEPVSTNEIIYLIAESQNRIPSILKISKSLIRFISKLGDKLHLPLNSERLHKLTQSYVISNQKLKKQIGKPLPVSSKEGLLKTFKSF